MQWNKNPSTSAEACEKLLDDAKNSLKGGYWQKAAEKLLELVSEDAFVRGTGSVGSFKKGYSIWKNGQDELDELLPLSRRGTRELDIDSVRHSEFFIS